MCSTATWTKTATVNKPIDRFIGEYRFLSNFHPSVVMFDGKQYATVEHAYQASKTLCSATRELIRRAPTPGKAKRLGRQVLLRPNWEETKGTVMLQLQFEKFKNPELKQLLLATGERKLQEGNNWGDREWGMVDGVGKNKLGKALMTVRAVLTCGHTAMLVSDGANFRCRDCGLTRLVDEDGGVHWV